MWTQKSFITKESGTLYLVPTPIGNLEDISFRAVRILKEVDLIAAEDTRKTRNLLNHYEIATSLISYHEHNKETSGRKIIDKLLVGENVALVSDAGMPTISDPGYELVVSALDNRLTVVPLPGANAALTALIASGLATQPFYFHGFLSRRKKDRKNALQLLKKQTATCIIYESPHRLKETLDDMLTVLGDRRIVICRELTKKFEEFIRGTVSEAIKWAKGNEVRGEFCLIIEGSTEETISEEPSWWDKLTIVEQVDFYIQNDGLSTKDAIKQTATDRQTSRREVYQAYHGRT